MLAAFRRAGHPLLEPLLLEQTGLHAEHHHVEALEASFKRHAAVPVAVGSGTINDLVKLASHRTGRPYLCVATAASMDGYTAFGASITFQGSKQTFTCPAPTAVLADLDVIRAAPKPMSAWGYADLLAKITSGADWLLADALGVEALIPKAWDIVQGTLRDWVADPAGVQAGTPQALECLVEGLIFSGLAMQCAQSSRAASGAEHQFSHLWDMQHHTHRGAAPSHGFKVGIGTLAVATLYERLLERSLEKLDVAACAAAWPGTATWLARAQAWLGEGSLLTVAARELEAKACDSGALAKQLETLRANWPKLRERLRNQLLPVPVLRTMLQAAGAPTEPEAIGISRARLRDSYRQAFCIRRRFTVLDVAMRTGLLEDCLDEIFGSQGLWPMGAADPSPAPTATQ